MNDKEIQLENKTKDLEQYLKKIKEMEVQYEYENFSKELSISNKKSKNLKSKI